MFHVIVLCTYTNIYNSRILLQINVTFCIDISNAICTLTHINHFIFTVYHFSRTLDQLESVLCIKGCLHLLVMKRTNEYT